MAEVVLDRVAKVYPNGFQAVHGLDLDIADGEFLVLVGPSGCGKSTVLRMLAGLEEITSGDLLIGGKRVNDVEPKARDIAMVFQNYALYPHMNVYDNIAFSLKLSGVPKAEIDKRVRETATTLELTEQLDKKPANLSGGQRQRVAMGRAIVRQPSAFLMDEPLSNLDAKLRVQMRAEIARIQQELGVTTVYVTHDQVEAMTMGDRVAVLKDGHLQQVDTPQNLYDSPANVFVAAFIGSPSMNLYQGELTLDGDRPATVKIGSQTLEVPAARFERSPALRAAGGPVIVGIRPEDLEDAAMLEAAGTGTTLSVGIDLVEALGSELMVHGAFDGRKVDAGDPDAPEPVVGKSNLVARLNPRSTVSRGDRVDLAVDVANLYFFDASSRLAL
jgi:multiple sugar transport system ATP-binding protein